MESAALFKLSYGLYLLSSADADGASGCIINTLEQVTSAPAQLIAVSNKSNYTTSLIERAGVFSATALTEGTDMGLIAAFGFRSGRDVDKFTDFHVELDGNGVPYIKNTMAAQFSCKVVQKLDVGTHILFVGQLTDARVLSDLPVMTYAYYHQVKKGTTPKNAPSYQAPTAQKGFRCTVCGYIEDKLDALPEDYTCPICMQPKGVFVPIA